MNAISMGALPQWLTWIFAATDDDTSSSANQGSSTTEEQEDVATEWSGEEEVPEDDFSSEESEWGEEDPINHEEEEKKEDEEINSSKDDKEKSVIYQKRKYREQIKALKERIADLTKVIPKAPQKPEEGADNEVAAKEYLRGLLKEVLNEQTTLEQQREREAQEAIENELEDLIEEHPTLSRKQILTTVKELGVTPTVAVKIIERDAKLLKLQKSKPSLPEPKRSGSLQKGEEKVVKPSSFAEAARMAKEALRNI